MTDFQNRILDFINRNGGDATTWVIAQVVFPERWTKKNSLRPYSGRGALIGHIDRATSKIPGMVRLPPRDQFGEAHFFVTIAATPAKEKNGK